MVGDKQVLGAELTVENAKDYQDWVREGEALGPGMNILISPSNAGLQDVPMGSPTMGSHSRQLHQRQQK